MNEAIQWKNGQTEIGNWWKKYRATLFINSSEKYPTDLEQIQTKTPSFYNVISFVADYVPVSSCSVPGGPVPRSTRKSSGERSLGRTGAGVRFSCKCS